jgi:hypothetical protein
MPGRPVEMKQLRIDRAFRLAHASILPTVALYVKQLSEADDLTTAVVVLQGCASICAGIYRALAIAARPTRGRGRFNKRAVFFATALAVGGAVRPLAAGALVQHLGFKDLAW